MAVTALTEEHQQAREGCVYFSLEDFCLVEAKGKDTFSFLQSQTTNDVLNLAVGAGLIFRSAYILLFSISGHGFVVTTLSICEVRSIHLDSSSDNSSKTTCLKTSLLTHK